MKLQPKQIEIINEWCYNARRLGYTKKDVKKRIKSYPRVVRKQIIKTFKEMEKASKTKNEWFNEMKDERRYNDKMPFKKKVVEEDEEDDEEPEIEDDTEDMEDVDPESEDEKRPVGRRSNAEKAQAQKAYQSRTPAIYRQPEQVVMKGAKDWLIRTIPQTFECIDPANGEVILKANSYEELMLKLQVMSTQHAVESAKNTR